MKAKKCLWQQLAEHVASILLLGASIQDLQSCEHDTRCRGIQIFVRVMAELSVHGGSTTGILPDLSEMWIWPYLRCPGFLMMIFQAWFFCKLPNMVPIKIWKAIQISFCCFQLGAITPLTLPLYFFSPGETWRKLTSPLLEPTSPKGIHSCLPMSPHTSLRWLIFIIHKQIPHTLSFFSWPYTLGSPHSLYEIHLKSKVNLLFQTALRFFKKVKQTYSYLETISEDICSTFHCFTKYSICWLLHTALGTSIPDI